MTRSAALSSINCTQCGAGLSVLGGGRVLTHVCGYCGAVLDTQDNYKVLTSIGKRDHPDSPVKIGMTLTVEGAEFTVIGTLGMIERYGGQTWRWVEHQLFSPTHGYAWLSWEDGNLLFTRKVRDYDMRHWLSSGTVERSEQPPTRRFRHETYRYYETTDARIDFMEGEFNWVPALDETTRTITLLGPSAMLNLVDGATEREVELTEMLDRSSTLDDLGIPPNSIGATRRHPLTPYEPLRDEAFLRRSAGFTALAAAVLGGLFWMMSGSPALQRQQVTVDSLPQSFAFQIDNTAQLARVEFESDVRNSWAVFSAEITGPDGQPVTAGARATEFYSGVDGGEAWSEGSRRASFLFRPEAAGPHVLTLALEEDNSEALRRPAAQTVAVSVRQGKPTGFWLLVAAVIAGITWILLGGRRAVHSSRRFSGSDWSD